MRLDGLVTNEELARRLSLAFGGERFPNAALLEGGSPELRRQLGLLLARAAVCSGQGERPCGQCPHCVKALAGSHPDVRVEGGGGAARSFHVETVRSIREDAYVKPNEAARRVFLLLEAQAMSEQAQNALLKVLEEPPPNVVFLLTAPSASALLPTVRSRAQLFRLPEEEQPPQEPQLLEQLAEALCAPGEAELLFLTAPLVKDRDRLRAVLEGLALLFRDACVLRAGASGCVSGLPGAAGRLSRALTRESLLRLLELTLQARRSLQQNANGALLVTALCAQLRAAAGR
ncbi:MAG TPA: ATP-binding protein [Candidatus Caccousia avistercoris]|nr:ATP-binding protein [Candidatus Caccousia avistercoris]